MKNQPHDLVPWEDLKDVSLHQRNNEKLDNNIFCKTWLTISETTVELISLVLVSLFENGRRQMTALKCQRQGGHMLFCEQET